jgi:hypothetical protein
MAIAPSSPGASKSAEQPRCGVLQTEAGEFVCEVTVTSANLADADFLSFKGMVSLGAIRNIIVGPRTLVLLLAGREYMASIESPPRGSTVPAIAPAVIAGRLMARGVPSTA